VVATDIGDGIQRAPLPSAFFERDPAVVARELLGQIIVSTRGGHLVAGRIVEVEAYLGTDDSGSHAATRGITPRNAVMFGPPARTYVYFTYGNHHMLNIVCDFEGTAGAVLIRALEPLVGLDIMRERRPGRGDIELTNGPGKLTAALGLDLSDGGARLGDSAVSVLEGDEVTAEQVAVSGRVGLSQGYELQLRFYVRDEPHVSKGRTGPPRERGNSRASRGGGSS